jgi:hypothetical protein
LKRTAEQNKGLIPYVFLHHRKGSALTMSCYY